MDRVYVIHNEWHDGVNGGAEVVGSRFFASEGEAWLHLKQIADAHDVGLYEDDTSFEETFGIDGEQEYYIGELYNDGQA
jgi:hypothetical protein